jgi:hypothetical protein
MTGIFGDGAILSGGEVTATAIPEPATLGLLLLGGVVVLLRQRRRQVPA